MSYPDATRLVIDYLTPIVAPAEVHSRVPAPRPATFVQIRRVGGTVLWPVRDQPRLAITAWAPTETAAHDLLMAARRAIWELKNAVTLGVSCYQVEEFSGPASATDDQSGDPRWQLVVALTLRAE
jgi:hypothetical protein